LLGDSGGRHTRHAHEHRQAAAHFKHRAQHGQLLVIRQRRRLAGAAAHDQSGNARIDEVSDQASQTVVVDGAMGKRGHERHPDACKVLHRKSPCVDRLTTVEEGDVAARRRVARLGCKLFRRSSDDGTASSGQMSCCFFDLRATTPQADGRGCDEVEVERTAAV
jgi:hypothetical protein